MLSGGGFNISPLKSQNGRPRTQVQHLMQIDLKGWGVGYFSSFQQHCLLQMLNSVAGELEMHLSAHIASFQVEVIFIFSILMCFFFSLDSFFSNATFFTSHRF